MIFWIDDNLLYWRVCCATSYNRVVYMYILNNISEGRGRCSASAHRAWLVFCSSWCCPMVCPNSNNIPAVVAMIVISDKGPVWIKTNEKPGDGSSGKGEESMEWWWGRQGIVCSMKKSAHEGAKAENAVRTSVGRKRKGLRRSTVFVSNAHLSRHMPRKWKGCCT